MKENLTRKNFIKQFLIYTTAVTGGAFLFNSCKSDDAKPEKNTGTQGETQAKSMVQPQSCNDLTGLSKEEIEKRKSLGYTEHAPSPDMKCEVCKLYLPPADGVKCGSCSLFKGFVDAEASCTYFAPIEA